MNCEHACGIAALAASGDATPAELQALETHTARCPACHAEVAAFGVLRAQLHSMREAAAPDSAYAAVRARVISQIEGSRQRRLIWAWSSLVAVAACAMVAILGLHPAPPTAEVRPPAAPVEIARIQEEEPRIPEPPTPHRIRREVRRIVAREPAEPIVVHMFTNDPDVVIYWVADAKVKSSNKEIVQ